jgi:hypothetical protein
MASWTTLQEQTVWIAPLAIAFTVVCDRCRELGEAFPSVQGTLALDRARGTVECPRGHTLRIERDGR